MDHRENNDFDSAFVLQMQEAMNDSLLEQQTPPPPEEEEEHGHEDQIAHLQTLELLHKYKIEMEDNENSQAEMRRVREELKRPDPNIQKLVREIQEVISDAILKIAELGLHYHGDNVDKPFGEGSSSSAALVEEEVKPEPFRLYFKGLFSDDRSGTAAVVAVPVCDSSGLMVLKVQEPLLGDWKAGWMDNLELKVEVETLIEGLTTVLSPDIK
ncbi:hypothetical protein Syun_001105 [Stephania yunnanensis]|uniref:Uncharacterized protein n=1 Tax=Stephania yunnanensis TaxID=152371 RepID=A0AAP0LE54_9MAGN